MGLNFSRLLRDDDLVEHFLVRVLQVDHKIPPETIRKIVTNEKMLIDFKEAENTLVSTKYRDRDCVNDMDRWKLRRQVIHELFTLRRTDKEDEIILGVGGALPKSGIKKESLYSDWSASIRKVDYCKRHSREGACYYIGL